MHLILLSNLALVNSHVRRLWNLLLTATCSLETLFVLLTLKVSSLLHSRHRTLRVRLLTLSVWINQKRLLLRTLKNAVLVNLNLQIFQTFVHFGVQITSRVFIWYGTVLKLTFWKDLLALVIVDDVNLVPHYERSMLFSVLHFAVGVCLDKIIVDDVWLVELEVGDLSSLLVNWWIGLALNNDVVRHVFLQISDALIRFLIVIDNALDFNWVVTH